MSPKILALALGLALGACNNGADNFDHAEGVSGGIVVAAGQPESVTDPRSGKAAPAAVGQVAKLNAVGTLDLRPDAAKTAEQPALVATIDPRTFAPTGTYTAGGGIPARGARAGQIAVFSDGKARVHPACAFPFPAPGNSVTTGLTVDGALTDWPLSGVVAVDRAGDAPSADLDVREVYFARDTTSLFFGVKFAGSWIAADDASRELIVDLRGLVLSADASHVPHSGGSQRYYVRGTQLYTDSGAVPQGTALGQVDFSLAVSDAGLELRLPRSVVEAGVGATFAVSVLSHDFASRRYDRTGAHVVGLTDDYACLVPLAASTGVNDHFKMVVLRRAPSVAAGTAEVGYRAFLAAMQAVDFAAKDHLASADTLSFAVEPMALPTVADDYEGIVVRDGVADGFGDAGTPREIFSLSAYTYAALYAAYDYVLPSAWTREGYARWMGIQAMGSYYGEAVAQFERHADARTIAREDAANPTATSRLIDNAHWHTGPFSTAYYTTKAGAFYALLARLVSYDDLLTGVLHEGRNGWPLADDDDFLHQFRDRRSYKGAATDDLGQGWLSGRDAGALVPAALLADTDGDGLLDYQEADAGTNAAATDTDQDGLADAAEIALGTPPTAAQGLVTLVADNYLGDWELLAPAQLKSTLAGSSSTTPCGNHTLITRYGAVMSEGWLVVPVELKAVPTKAQGVQVYLTIESPTAATQTVVAPWGEQYVTIIGGVPAVIRSLTPFADRTIEIAVNATALGWTGGALPAGTTVTVAATATGATTACSDTDRLAPTTTLP